MSVFKIYFSSIEDNKNPASTIVILENNTRKSFRDLTDDMPSIVDHWRKENISFDAIYTGYLGSVEQINSVIDFINDFKKESTIVFVDPAMADKGKLYTGFDSDFPSHMARLCAKADIIVPNITEASLMLGVNDVFL